MRFHYRLVAASIALAALAACGTSVPEGPAPMRLEACKNACTHHTDPSDTACRDFCLTVCEDPKCTGYYVDKQGNVVDNPTDFQNLDHVECDEVGVSWWDTDSAWSCNHSGYFTN